MTTNLHHPELIQIANSLSNKGTLKVSDQQLLYLDIDDAFIHILNPLIGSGNIEKPDYFSEGGVGAHISVIYANEKLDPDFDDSQVFLFQVNQLMKAETIDTIYYAITVTSPSLLQVRHQNQLEDILDLNGYRLPMHITIGKTRLL